MLALLVALASSQMAAAQPKDPEPPPAVDPTLEVEDKHDEQQKAADVGASSPARGDVDAPSEPPKREDESDPDKKFTLSAYVETFYQWNFNQPGNGISNHRGYDTRHNTVSLQNAVIDAGFRAKDLLGRIAVQYGTAPATYYLLEPDHAGSDGAGESNALVWRYLQRASAGWQATRALLFEAGLFPAATGAEGLAVKDNWNWSRANPSVRLPNYQTGFRGTWQMNDRLALVASVINGWNTVVDNNDEKSVVMALQYKVARKLTAQASYFGGVERDPGAPEGRPWRHGLEVWAQLDATDRLAFALDGSAGLENTRFGVHYWTTIAGYARVKLVEWLFFAARADRLWEEIAASRLGASRAFLSPAARMTSLTGTFDFRPVQGLSTRLEVRHDRADDEVYFRGKVEGDGSAASPYLPNTRYQTTALLGVVVWF